ncbi:MAG: succinyl-diaminopimelate desuccinylase [Acidimicrobiia bacterium]
MTDVFALAAELVGVRSESHHETEIADLVEARLRAAAPGLVITRIGDNVVARTELGHDRRIVLGGHLDTVPANDNAVACIDGDTLRGLGSADMKGGLAVLLVLAERAGEARFDVSVVFYEAEEVAEEFNGLRTLFRDHPDLVAGDLAILLEPTGGWVEAGCQGTLHLRAEFDGTRAHSARPWMGENAIHRAATVLTRLAEHEADTVSVDGLAYRESLQVVRIEGGIADNVVPDSCAIVVNRRFAPKYSIKEAREQTEVLLAGADRIEVLNASPAAPPNLMNPLVAEFIGTLDLAVRPKLGWTDVARFASHGIPALNFGSGDPEIAHTQGEFVTREAVEGCHAVLAHFLGIEAKTA